MRLWHFTLSKHGCLSCSVWKRVYPNKNNSFKVGCTGNVLRRVTRSFNFCFAMHQQLICWQITIFFSTSSTDCILSYIYRIFPLLNYFLKIKIIMDIKNIFTSHKPNQQRWSLIRRSTVPVVTSYSCKRYFYGRAGETRGRGNQTKHTSKNLTLCHYVILAIAKTYFPEGCISLNTKYCTWLWQLYHTYSMIDMQCE
jgi:hypothetical protein